MDIPTWASSNNQLLFGAGNDANTLAVPPQPSPLMVTSDPRQLPTPLESFLAAPPPRPPPPPAHAPASYTRTTPRGAPAWKGGGSNHFDPSGVRLSSGSNPAMATLLAAQVSAKARTARAKLRQSAELRLQQSEARKSAEIVMGGNQTAHELNQQPPLPAHPPAADAADHSNQPRPRAVYKPGRGRVAMAKLTGAMHSKQVSRRRNVEHPLYEGTIRGNKMQHQSRFVAASRVRAVARIRMHRKERGARAYSDENQAPPPKTGLDLFLEAKRIEFDPRGRMVPSAVERRAMWQWRRMDDSDPNDDRDRRFWHNRAEEQNKVRDAALELEWDRNNPSVPEPTPKNVRPIHEKRAVFELERSIKGQRPDRISTHVFEQSLRNNNQSIEEIREAHKQAALRSRGGTLAFTDKAEVSRPDETEAKGPWRTRPRPEWERPWKQQQAAAVAVPATLIAAQMSPAGEKQQKATSINPKATVDDADTIAGGNYADKLRTSMEKQKDSSLLAEYLSSRDAPLTDALRESLNLPVSQQTPALHDNSSSVADIDGGRPTKGLSTNQSQDADYQGAAALLLDQKRWLRTFYATHNPRRLHDHPELVEELLAKWYGREQELFRRLQVKYDRLAKEIRNGKAALKAVANSGGENNLRGGQERYQYGPRKQQAGSLGATGSIRPLTTADIATQEAGDLPRTMINNPSIESYVHRRSDAFMNPTESSQIKADPTYQPPEATKTAGSKSTVKYAQTKGASFGPPFDQKHPTAVRTSRDEPGAVFGLPSDSNTSVRAHRNSNTISSSPPPPPLQSSSTSPPLPLSSSPPRSRSRSPSWRHQQVLSPSPRSDAAVGSSPPRRSHSRERSGVPERFSSKSSSSQSPNIRSLSPSQKYRKQSQVQVRSRATSPFDEEVLQRVLPGHGVFTHESQRGFHSRRHSRDHHSPDHSRPDSKTHELHVRHHSAGGYQSNIAPFPAPAGVAGGSDLGTLVNAVSGFMGGAAMMLQECRDALADGTSRRQGTLRGHARRRYRREEYKNGNDSSCSEDDVDDSYLDSHDEGREGNDTKSQYDAGFSTQSRGARKHGGRSRAGAEALQVWAEAPPPSRNALLQRLSDKLDDLESYEATVAARFRARRALLERQAKLDTEAAATGTNLRTAVQGADIGGNEVAVLPLGAVVHALAEGSDLPAVAGSDHVANPSKGSEALQVFKGAAAARSFRAVQPIDVSLDASKAEELRAHAEQFKLYRRHTCETQLLATGMSQAAIIELLAEDIVSDIMNQSAKEIESVVEECAQAVFDRI